MASPKWSDFPVPEQGNLPLYFLFPLLISFPLQDPSMEPVRSPAAERSETSWVCQGLYTVLASPTFLFPSPLHPGRGVCSGGLQETDPSLLCFDSSPGPWRLAGLALPGQRGAGGTPAGGRGDLCLCHPLRWFELPRSPWEQKTTFLATDVRGYSFTISKKMCLHWWMPATACWGDCWGPEGERGPRWVTGTAQHQHQTADAGISFPAFLTRTFAKK